MKKFSSSNEKNKILYGASWQTLHSVHFKVQNLYILPCSFLNPSYDILLSHSTLMLVVTCNRMSTARVFCAEIWSPKRDCACSVFASFTLLNGCVCDLLYSVVHISIVVHVALCIWFEHRASRSVWSVHAQILKMEDKGFKCNPDTGFKKLCDNAT